MLDVSSVAFVSLFGLCVVVALSFVMLGIRKHDQLDGILNRAQWPLLYALLFLQFGVPSVRAFAIMGMVLLVIRATWSFLRQRHIARGGTSRGPHQG